MSQECFRRIHNTSNECKSEVKVDILNEFMIDLKTSGYKECERKVILEAGLKTHWNLKHKEATGQRPYYRSAKFKLSNKTEIENVKKKKKHNWYRKGSEGDKFKSVIFVPATPGDKLLKMFKETEARNFISETCRIKFVSSAGIKLKSILTRKDPYKKKLHGGS